MTVGGLSGSFLSAGTYARKRESRPNAAIVAILGCAMLWSSLAIDILHAADSTGVNPRCSEGQTIEVREGDTWSAATVLKR